MGAEPGSVLGLDPGERRIGVALAVPGTSMALPLTVLDRNDEWEAALRALVAEHRVAGIVVGLPVSLSGTEGAAAVGARSFAAHVASLVALPVDLVDERLSTVAAGRALAAAGAGGRRQRGVIDASAAAVILQAWLDARGAPA